MPQLLEGGDEGGGGGGGKPRRQLLEGGDGGGGELLGEGGCGWCAGWRSWKSRAKLVRP